MTKRKTFWQLRQENSTECVGCGQEKRHAGKPASSLICCDQCWRRIPGWMRRLFVSTAESHDGIGPSEWERRIAVFLTFLRAGFSGVNDMTEGYMAEAVCEWCANNPGKEVDVGQLIARAEAAEREVERLRGALQPFANLVDGDLDNVGGGTALGFDGKLTAGMIKAAKAALSPEKQAPDD